MIAVCLALVPAAVASLPDFDARFTGRTLRIEYAHLGTQGQEHISLDRLRIEGDWAGSRTHLVDDSNLGNYRAVAIDVATKTIEWSRGFSSIYGEWETTAEAKTAWRSFEESTRLPEPKAPFEFVLEKRGDDGAFRRLWSTAVDPSSRWVDRSPPAIIGELETIFESGPSATKVDLLLVGDGYTADEKERWRADAKRLSEVLFATEPYHRHRSDFNLRALFLPSMESGIRNPRKGVWKRDALDLSFNAFDSDRYVLDFADKKLREATERVPYDALVLVFNDRKYGGGGIYNLWSTCSAGSESAPYLLVHEFGHAFAGLADEYYTSQVAYESSGAPTLEPWEPNVTALADPKALKWKDLVDPATPIPTPWKQAQFDALDLAYQQKRQEAIQAKASEELNESLMRDVKAATEPVLAAEKFFGKVGAFEGAAYQAKGLFRPEVDCIMFTRNPTHFCKVCERAVEAAIGRLTR